MPKVYPELKSSPVIKRHPNNPILSRKDIPYESTQIYNAGVTKYQGKYVMVFRNDVRTAYGELQCKRIELGIAYSDDGIVWKAEDKPFFTASMLNNDEIKHIYDPRLTVIDGQLHMCFAVDTKHGVCGGVGIIHNMERLEIKSLSTPDNRNMVLFPEKINGLYTRLERPFPIYGRAKGSHKFDVWMSQSPDLEFWGRSKLVLGTEHVPLCNDKIGPAAPPVKTEKGWLTTFHFVDSDPDWGKNGWEENWTKRYSAGIMLLDLNDPSEVVGMSKLPLIAPETEYEVDEGIRQNVIFPGGMILEDNGEVKIYYGAADTVECLATANVSKDEFVKLKEHYQEEIDKLTEELKTEKEKNVMFENKEEVIKEICSVVTNLVQFETFDDSIAKEVLEQIIINSKSDLEVYLKGIPDKTFFFYG